MPAERLVFLCTYEILPSADSNLFPGATAPVRAPVTLHGIEIYRIHHSFAPGGPFSPGGPPTTLPHGCESYSPNRSSDLTTHLHQLNSSGSLVFCGFAPRP